MRTNFVSDVQGVKRFCILPRVNERIRELRPPIGKYRIVGLIGTGGMGVVYRGYDPDLDREVAVKVLKSGVLEKPDHLERFKRECRAAAKLSHSGVVHVYDAGVIEGSPYLVMELVEGTSLALKLVEGRMAVDTAVEIACELCEAVQYLHDHHVVNRDIKPSNIIITPVGRVKLLDFGLAVVMEETRAITMTGEAIGTPRYMAPEQLESDHEKINERTDVYAIGAVLYETLTGRPPVEGPNLYAVLHAIRMAAPAPPSTINPEATPSLDAIVMKCLAKANDERFASASDVRRAIQARRKDAPTVRREPAARPAATPATPAPSLDDEPVRIRRHGQRRRRKLDPKLIAALVVLAAVPVAVILMSKPWETTGDPGPFIPKPIEVRVREEFQRAMEEPAEKRRSDLLAQILKDIDGIEPAARNAELWMWNARALRAEGRFQQAAEAAEAAVKADPARADVAAEQAWGAWIAQDLLLHGLVPVETLPSPQTPEQQSLLDGFQAVVAGRTPVVIEERWREFKVIRAMMEANPENVGLALAIADDAIRSSADLALLKATLQAMAGDAAKAKRALIGQEEDADWRFAAATAALMEPKSGAEFEATLGKIPREDIKARLRAGQ